VTETHALLQENIPFLTTLSTRLMEKGSLETTEVAEIAASFGLSAAIKPEGYLHLPEYGDKLKEQ
jgi:hypothetical protein